MYIHTHTQYICTYTWTHICTHNTHVHTHAYTCAHTVHVCIHMHTQIHTIHTYAYTHMHTCIHPLKHTHTHNKGAYQMKTKKENERLKWNLERQGLSQAEVRLRLDLER